MTFFCFIYYRVHWGEYRWNQRCSCGQQLVPVSIDYLGDRIPCKWFSYESSWLLSQRSFQIMSAIYSFLCLIFQFIFEFLAFKNDISFWRKKKNMVGMSRKTGESEGGVKYICIIMHFMFLFMHPRFHANFLIELGKMRCQAWNTFQIAPYSLYSTLLLTKAQRAFIKSSVL